MSSQQGIPCSFHAEEITQKGLYGKQLRARGPGPNLVIDNLSIVICVYYNFTTLFGYSAINNSFTFESNRLRIIVQFATMRFLRSCGLRILF